MIFGSFSISSGICLLQGCFRPIFVDILKITISIMITNLLPTGSLFKSFSLSSKHLLLECLFSFFFREIRERRKRNKRRVIQLCNVFFMNQCVFMFPSRRLWTVYMLAYDIAEHKGKCFIQGLGIHIPWRYQGIRKHCP